MDAHTEPRERRIRLRQEAFDAAAALRGWRGNTAIARGLSADRTTVSRVRRGVLQPGVGFIAAALALGQFEELFEVTELDAA